MVGHGLYGSLLAVEQAHIKTIALSTHIKQPAAREMVLERGGGGEGERGEGRGERGEGRGERGGEGERGRGREGGGVKSGKNHTRI